METMVLAEGMAGWTSLGEFIVAYAAEDEQQVCYLSSHGLRYVDEAMPL
jgi:hypothetical protein